MQATPQNVSTESGSEQPRLDLALRENAYDFIQAAIEQAELAEAQPLRWKFAIVHLAQALELLLKALLWQEHPLLMMANVDGSSRQTVSFEKSLERLERCNVVLTAADRRRLSAARTLRNELVHFHNNSKGKHLEAAFLDLFEFAHTFHLAELGAELHGYLDENWWPMEAELMLTFRTALITYQGVEIPPAYAVEIVAAQTMRVVVLPDGRELDRIPFADDNDLMTPSSTQTHCHDCEVLPGQLHIPGCCCEGCPYCGHQFMYSCDNCQAALPDDPDDSETQQAS